MTDEVNLDIERESRTGLSEAVFSEGKSDTQLLDICDALKTHNKDMLFTRLTPPQFNLIDEAHPGFLSYDPVSRTASNLRTANAERSNRNNAPNVSPASVAIVSGGSSDVPIASEAKKTLEYYGVNSLMISDVGVAGLWRLTERLQDIQNHKVVICIAGMDAALPTVLGGLISSALIAVPTSVGYGMAEGGETALRALLVSCAPGISVVNIDNGYGAACAAIRILNQIS
ncbi:MAG: nickel pincer cofactor biosynthesis protein LarB [Pseudomonadales bacterium]|nr:nickel pincer cofactor biosynthesis protein LarB [Pseudomonadales bacterium]|tara:strand:+ start:1348 stop:2034 length:687 start_codon:yes stop_codon:yes gene_type:complete